MVKTSLQADGPTPFAEAFVIAWGGGGEGKLTRRAMNMFGVQSDSEATVPSKPMLLGKVRIARVQGGERRGSVAEGKSRM